jgi:hypothetical protein
MSEAFGPPRGCCQRPKARRTNAPALPGSSLAINTAARRATPTGNRRHRGNIADRRRTSTSNREEIRAAHRGRRRDRDRSRDRSRDRDTARRGTKTSSGRRPTTRRSGHDGSLAASGLCASAAPCAPAFAEGAGGWDGEARAEFCPRRGEREPARVRRRYAVERRRGAARAQFRRGYAVERRRGAARAQFRRGYAVERRRAAARAPVGRRGAQERWCGAKRCHAAQHEPGGIDAPLRRSAAKDPRRRPRAATPKRTRVRGRRASISCSSPFAAAGSHRPSPENKLYANACLRDDPRQIALFIDCRDGPRAAS